MCPMLQQQKKQKPRICQIFHIKPKMCYVQERARFTIEKATKDYLIQLINVCTRYITNFGDCMRAHCTLSARVNAFFFVLVCVFSSSLLHLLHLLCCCAFFIWLLLLIFLIFFLFVFICCKPPPLSLLFAVCCCRIRLIIIFVVDV